ncbi:hypothetical protein M9Y10_023161 [Tritrichomonas musculus]|uniref:Viral A-type inclusion protein n=1 Tax=Tritrichomonas musculus TaxID=1915356 RepID=A0ABR2KUB2_9EUKA
MFNDSDDLLISGSSSGDLDPEDAGSFAKQNRSNANSSSILYPGSPTYSTSKRTASNSNSELENAKLRSKNKELKSRLKMMEDRYRSDSQNMSSELNLARQEGQEARKNLIDTAKSLEKKLNEQMKITNGLNKVNKQLQAQISSFLARVSSKTGRDVQNLNEASDLYDELSYEVESSSNRIKELEGLNSSLSEQLDDAEGIARNKAGESAKLKKKIKRLKEELSSNSNNQQEVQGSKKKSKDKKKKQVDDELEKQKKEIERLQNALDQEKSKKLQVKTRGIDGFLIEDNNDPNPKSSNEELNKANLALLNDRVQNAEKTSTDLQKQLEQLQFENNQLSERGNQIADQLNEAKENLKEREAYANELKSKLKDLKSQNRELNDELKSKETEIADLDTTVHELNLRINELENDKQKEANRKKATSNSNEKDSRESIRQLKDRNELLEKRIASFEELYEEQSNEIVDLFSQRNKLIASLKQVDELLTSNESQIQNLSKSNASLNEENKRIKTDLIGEKERSEEEFRQTFEDSLENLPHEVRERLKDLEDDFLHDPQKQLSHSEVLQRYVICLTNLMSEIEKNSQVAKDNSRAEALRVRYIVLLEHLEKAHKLLRQIANSSSSFSGGSDEITRQEFLTACTRLGTFIEEQRIEFPIEEFKPSIFEPRDINDPQRVADVFLDFVKKEQLETSPIAELFTLFMCVTQINLILMNNIDANKQAVMNAARVSQQNSDQQMRIKELQDLESRKTEEQEKLKPYLAHLVPDPSDNYEELVRQITEELNHEDVPSPRVYKALVSKIDELEEQIDKLQKEIEKSHHKSENNREQFCKKAEGIVSDVQKQVENQMKKFNEEKQMMQKEIDQLRSQNSNVAQDYEARLKKQQKKLQKREDLINTLRSENESLTQRSMDLTQQLGQHQSQADEDSDAIISLRSQLKQAKEEAERAKNQKKSYKERLDEAEKVNASTLLDLKTRNENLNKKYAKTIEDLQQQLKKANDDLLNAEKELSTYNDKKRELLESNAKLQMAKRNCELKLKAADDALARERASNEAKQTTYALALKSKSDATIEKIQGDLEKCQNLFFRVLKEEFGQDSNENKFKQTSDNSNQHQKEDNPNFDDNYFVGDKYEQQHQQISTLLEQIEEAMEKRKDENNAIKDALKLRRILKLDSSDSLIKIFDDLRSSTEFEKQRANKAEEFASDISNINEKLQRDTNKLERNTNELKEWNDWSRSLLSQISDTAPPNPPSNEVRYMLEEALLVALNQRTTRRKLELLRTEKKLIKSSPKSTLNLLLQPSKSTSGGNSGKSKNNINNPDRNKVFSMRPMMLAFIFSGRLQEFSGTVPSKFNGLTKANAPPLQQTPYDTRRAQRPLVPYDSQ